MRRPPPRLYSTMLRTTIFALVLVPAAALAGEIIPGPITADVVSVYDGDTLTVDAHPWPQITVRTSVRVDGIDTPEIRGKCDSEKAMAREARDLARESDGEHIHLRNVGLGKYAGRVIADVFTEDGRRLADVLIEARLARVYDGGERQGWCE